MAKSKNALKWRFDVNTFRLLGRDLITDRITALFELVKNSYDANAENVTIEFSNIGKRHDDSKIIIKDDGIGMSLKDIEDKWMVIGSNSKRNQLYSPKPYERRYIGEKGIGRFAVDKLGQYVRIRTKQKNDKKELVVTINWQTYEDLAKKKKTLKLFTDIENEYHYEKSTFEKGTILEILLPRDLWTLDDLVRADKELSRLVSPFHEAKYPFNINLLASEYEPYNSSKIVVSKEKDFASHSFELDYDLKKGKQEYLFFDTKKKQLIIKEAEKPSFGFIKFHLFYFDTDAKARFNSFYKNTSTNIDGLKIYRDGILTTPFAEYEAEDSKRRDVLGLNKRRWRATFDRIGSREIIGYIEITREGNPAIVDSTNRQDFLGTREYRELKDFIFDQLDTFMKTYKVERAEKKQKRLGAFSESQKTLKSIQKTFEKLQKPQNDKKQAEVIKTLSQQVEKLNDGFKAINTEYKEAQKDEKRKEKMYFSLMSLSLFAANVSHAVRTTIYSIKDDAQFISEEKFTLANKELYQKYADRIFREIQRLLKVVDFMLKYAKTDLPSEYFNVNEIIQNVFDAHETIFLQNNIEIKLDIDSNISVFGNKVFFQDIITNLISNSIKAIEGNLKKVIQCTAKANKNEMQISFSDNGVGIPINKWEKVFDVYYTTTADQGGAGVGLYVVKTNIETMGGNVEVIDSEFKGEGTTFCLTIPFNK